MIPARILDIFAAVMLAVAAVSAARVLTARPWRQGTKQAALVDVDVAHLLMAIAMAGMLTASLRPLPNGAWDAIFGVMTAWFAYRVLRDSQVSGVRALAGGHCAPHLVHAAAMLYMFLALAGPAAHGAGMDGISGMSGMGTLSLPFLALVFALLLIGYSVWDLDQLSGPGASGHYSLAAARMAPSGVVLAGVASSAVAEPGAALVSEPGAALVSGLASAAVATDPVTTAQAPPVGAGTVAGGSGRTILAPWVATSCRIAMGVTMAFMLLITI